MVRGFFLCGSRTNPPLTLHYWWTYQRERLPLIVNGRLVTVFSLGALCHTAGLRQAMKLPGWRPTLGAVVTVLGPLNGDEPVGKGRSCSSGRAPGYAVSTTVRP